MATLSDSLIASMRDQAYNMRGQPITVRYPSATSVNYTTGDITNQYTDTAVSKALLGRVETLKTSDKRRTCRVRSADVSTGITVACVIKIGTVTWRIKDIRFDATEYAYNMILETS